MMGEQASDGEFSAAVCSLRAEVAEAQDALLAINRLPPPMVPNALADSYSMAAITADRSIQATAVLFRQLLDGGADEDTLRAFYEAVVCHGAASTCRYLSHVCMTQLEEANFDRQNGGVAGHA